MLKNILPDKQKSVKSSTKVAIEISCTLISWEGNFLVGCLEKSNDSHCMCYMWLYVSQ